MKKACWIIGIALAAAGCVTTQPVEESLIRYEGDGITGVEGLTFDGEAFRAPGMETVPREEVKVVQFRLSEPEAGEETGPGPEATLSELAASQLERGKAMAAAYPGVSGVVLVDDGEFVYHEDGTSAYRYHFVGLVLKEEAKAWAQFMAGFTDGRSRVRLDFARSVSPDGTVQRLGQEGLQAASPSEAAAFFNPNRKVLSGVIPGVEVGSIVEYAYEFERYDPERPEMFFPGYFFQGTDPVAFSRVKVTVPRGTPFHYTTRNFPDEANGEPLVTENAASVDYVWLVQESPPLTPEPLMPPERDLVPMMEGSVFTDFEAAYALQRNLQEPRMELTPEIDAEVREITAGLGGTEAKLAAIYHWVQENTRYISIKGSLGAGWSGHAAAETFENRYGDCTDKAILLATMCKAIGVTAYPVIVRTNDSGVGIVEIPTMDGNHAINEVELDGRRFYLDSTSENYRYPYFRADDHGAYAINSMTGEINKIPVPPPEDNGRVSHLDVTLRENGDVFVRTRNRYTGPYEASVRGYWKQVREDNRKLRMTGYVNTISPGAVLDSFTLSDVADLGEQLEMSIDYALPGHAIRAKELMYLRMPTLEREFPEAALEARRYPVQYYTTEARELSIDLHLPEGYRAAWLPEKLEITSAYLDYAAEYEDAGDVIRLRQRFRRLKRIVPVEDYAAYREHLRAISAFTKKEIFVTEEQ